MYMIIEIGSYSCGSGGHCQLTAGPRHAGHAFIEVRNGAQEAWARRPAWASLEYDRAPFKSATEGLRWAVAQLEANLRAATLDATDDDYAELLG